MGRASVELHRIAGEVARIPDTGLIAAAKLVKKLADDEARRVTGDANMLGNKRRAIKLRARDKGIRPVAGGAAVLILGQPAGPWVWVNTGTAPHAIRRRKRGPMRNMTVRHPGTSGRLAWRRVVTRAEDLVPRIFVELAGRAVSS